MSWSDPTTVLGVAGIAGTLLGAITGALGTLGAASITGRKQAATEEQRARRQAYNECATALLAARNAVDALLETVVGGGDNAAVQARLQHVDEQRAIVARAVGAVAVEGPYEVAHDAEFAARAIEILSGRVRDWSTMVADGTDREELLRSQLQYARRDSIEVERSVDNFTAGCRKVLRPGESDRPTRRGLLQRLRRR